MPAALIESLEQCQTLEQFYELCAPLGLYASGRRFMQIELDITNRCNLRCVMCYHSFESTRRSKTVHMTPDDFARIAARALPHAHRLSLSLGNEPLMSPHFIDTSALRFRYHPDRNFVRFGGKQTPINQDAIVQHIGFFGEVTMNNPLHMAKLYDSSP